ncbi:hypothetical protein [Streptosporangium carneum]|uniref:Uncharacterized protein n=1 Tax=Streptosporangium carneum TaxID=47481 RepID=A0A9W6HXN8_9ACTN|nr:hypothetical protein [Streptosporangium carneum]GLK07294.1 hypothetical protein GCM10017600_06990 [Streptosporangium carneum]
MSENSKRIVATVLLVTDGIGEQLDMAHVAIGGTNASTLVPASRIAEDTGVPVNELPGRKFGALWTIGEDDEELSDFRLLNDPRIYRG